VNAGKSKTRIEIETGLKWCCFACADSRQKSDFIGASMIDISERAQQHFLRLLSQQGGDGMSIRLRVTQPGTAVANCELEFCEPADLAGGEWTIECAGFDFHVDGDSARWLDGATIDFETNMTGGQLNIRAPKIKGDVPGAESGLIERVRYVLDAEINPQLASHGGRVTLLEIDAEGVVLLQFGGGCHGCGMVDVTLKQGVEKTLRERVPEITAVRDATDHAVGEKPYYDKTGGKSAVV
jgi:Fe/S biogenesis protein NfuA